MTFKLDDALNIEGEAQSEEDYYASLQRAINDGLWSLPGRNGRAMHDAISYGKCLLGRKAFRDYYGNTVPGRDDVKAGTKGSRQFVADRFGEDWAAEMESI